MDCGLKEPHKTRGRRFPDALKTFQETPENHRDLGLLVKPVALLK